ncbi:MAG TPA: AlkA N-terminal domain-containing protein, partial [Candidatus Nanopelagicales bacterium]|nr:AlkA N-terminal domain-containing protein [Candidatus Nanopelagicales bacterium]
LAGRALRLIADGAVDDGGVAGLAGRLHVSERHLHRTLVAEVGAGPLQLALSRRAQTARMLVDQTTLPLTDVAYAAGFASIRQFNDVMRREFGTAPSALRRTRAPALSAADPSLVLRLKVRPPYDAAAVGEFLAARAVPGLELHAGATGGWTHQRTVPLPRGAAVVSVRPADGHVVLRAGAADLADTGALVRVIRRWLDLDADPDSVGAVLGADPALAASVACRPGLRVPTTVDPWETCVRAVIGQQVSVAGATTLLGRLVAGYGDLHAGSALRRFPTAAVLAEADPERLAAIGMPASRGRTLHGLALAVAGGDLPLAGGSREDCLAVLAGLPGIGPWTSDYVALRAFGDPDAFPATDLGVRHGAASLGLPELARDLTGHAERWRPWRAYAATHLWAHAATHQKNLKNQKNSTKESR